jgi:hypothetical protein
MEMITALSKASGKQVRNILDLFVLSGNATTLYIRV